MHIAASPAASLLDTKLFVNSVISDSNKCARFLSHDLKDHFIQTIMSKPEFMSIHIRFFPNDIKEKYHIKSLVSNDGSVYCKIKRGIYGLKQAERLACDLLVKRLVLYGYSPTKKFPKIWQHATIPTKLCLCIDGFGVQFFKREDAMHLINALKIITKYPSTKKEKSIVACC